MAAKRLRPLYLNFNLMERQANSIGSQNEALRKTEQQSEYFHLITGNNNREKKLIKIAFLVSIMTIMFFYGH